MTGSFPARAPPSSARAPSPMRSRRGSPPRAGPSSAARRAAAPGRPRRVAKTILCGCEDVTAADVRRAYEKGYRDLESVKRYTGIGTGPCQGKACLAVAARELLRLGATPGEVAPFTVRPPIQPTPLAALAALDPAALPLAAGVPLEGK